MDKLESFIDHEIGEMMSSNATIENLHVFVSSLSRLKN